MDDAINTKKHEHSNEDNLITIISQINVIPNQIYYHYKSPYKKYKVLLVALDEETEEPVVIYQAQYGNNLIWARKLKIWNQLVDNNGEQTSRFIYVESI